MEKGVRTALVVASAVVVLLVAALVVLAIKKEGLDTISGPDLPYLKRG